MNEQYKLREAQYFLQRMRAEHNNPTAFRLSAFLAAFLGHYCIGSNASSEITHFVVVRLIWKNTK
jgi:hypothetical protein